MRESQRGASDASNKIKSWFLEYLWISIYSLTLPIPPALVEDVVPILQTDEPFANKKGMLKDYIEV